MAPFSLSSLPGPNASLTSQHREICTWAGTLPPQHSPLPALSLSLSDPNRRSLPTAAPPSRHDTAFPAHRESLPFVFDVTLLGWCLSHFLQRVEAGHRNVHDACRSVSSTNKVSLCSLVSLELGSERSASHSLLSAGIKDAHYLVFCIFCVGQKQSE